MAVSVRMDPLLEKELALAAKSRGISKSQFIIEAVQRSLGQADPHRLLLQVEQEMAPYRVKGAKSASKSAPVVEGAATSHSERLRVILRAKHEAELSDWQKAKAPAARRRAGA